MSGVMALPACLGKLYRKHGMLQRSRTDERNISKPCRDFMVGGSHFVVEVRCGGMEEDVKVMYLRVKGNEMVAACLVGCTIEVKRRQEQNSRTTTT